MYTRLKNTQIVIALLKKHNIRHLVLSAGQSNNNFVRSVETDDFFTCYSVVDERSAAFFALGLAQELKEPVAISCTASTACCNYLSAITEAYHQGVPILVLTSNKDIRRTDQLELLMIHQESIFKDVCKKEIQLPEVRDKRDFNFCTRLVNDAILELNHNGNGPVHIDIPSYGNDATVDVSQLPQVRAIYRHKLTEGCKKYKEKLLSSKKIMLLCGQGFYSEKDQALIKKFYDHFNCVVVAEQMANLRLDDVINMNPITNSPIELTNDMLPDILITFGRHIMNATWSKLRNKGIEHWYVDISGKVVDPCDALTEIFECEISEFLSYMVKNSENVNKKKYFNVWNKAYNSLIVPDLPLCHISVIQKLFEMLPEKGLIHYSIFNSIRLSQHFKLPKGFRCYANLGALGIDGCLSTFLGQASVTDEPAFLIIGDLSFFYDMNALKIRHIKNNVHILMINNSGGAEFYQNNGYYETLDLHTAAKHNNTAKAWAEECGFKYTAADNLEDLDSKMKQFVSFSDAPVFFEVKTDIQTDMNALYKMNEVNSSKKTDSGSVKSIAKKFLGEKGSKLVGGMVKEYRDYKKFKESKNEH